MTAITTTITRIINTAACVFHKTIDGAIIRALVLVLLVLMACQQAQIPIEEGISKTLADWRVQHIRQIGYELRFAIPGSQSRSISAIETVRFSLNKTDLDLQLDFKAGSGAVSKLVCNGQPVPVNQICQHLVVPKQFLKNGDNELVILFTPPDQSLNRNPEFLYTLLVPDRASTLFPCFDQPNLKARFYLTLDVPRWWKAVANAPEEERTETDSTQVIRYAQTELLPTYLFAFSAGKFDTICRRHNGETFTLYHRETNQEKLKNNIDEIFRLLFLSLDSIEHYTGIPYPYKKYDLVAVPSFQYSGMEHPGAALYRSSALFLEGTPTRQELLNRANLIAHETAHMWFGDLVTMPWFDEVWMKEVLANFIADKVVSPLFPEFNQDLLFLMAHQYAAYSVDRTEGANSIGQPLANLSDAGSLYGPIIYHKAPIVMNMLENKIGKPALQKGLQEYLRNFAFGNAGWNDLIALLDSDDSLRKWSDSWVYEPGRPHLKASVEKGNLKVAQLDPAGKSRNWGQSIEVIWPEDGTIKHQKVAVSGKLTVINNLFSGTPKWLYLNANGGGYGYFEMDRQTLQFFCQNVGSLDDDLLRASVWTDLFENLTEDKLYADEFLEAVLKNLPDEKNQVIYERILTYLNDVFTYRAADEIRAAFAQRVESMLWSQMDVRTDFRNALLNTAIRLCSTAGSLARLDSIGTGLLDKYPATAEQKTTLAYYLALRQPDRAIQILNDREQLLENADQVRRFRFVRQSLNPDQAARDAFFNSLLKKENREHEPWVNEAMAFLNHPLREYESLKYLRPALDVLQEIQVTGDIFFPQSWLDNLLKGHRSPEAADTVRRFLNDHPDYPENLKRKILQSGDFLLKQVAGR
jgi:aminopeptidase N